MNRKTKLSIPTYLESFQCIGGDCSDTCCRGWQVSIDEQTYKKYRKLNTSELGKRLSKYICKNRQTNQGGAYAYIQLEQGQCPFLTSSCRCEIQEKVGHSYLSKTCQTYPRYLKKIGNNYEMTGVLSCPVVAKHVLLGGKEIFTLNLREISEQEALTYVLSQKLDDDRDSLQIRNWLIRLMQDHRFSLQDRLIMTVMFSHLVTTDKSLEVKKFLAESSDLLTSSEWQQEIFGLRSFADHNQALNNFIKIAKKQIGKDNGLNVFILMINESLKGLLSKRNQEGSNWIEVLLNIQETSDGKRLDQILENYAVHYLMQSGKSFSSEQILANIEQLLIRLSFFRILWAGLISHYGDLDSDQVVQTVQKFTKHYEHSELFKTSMNSIFEELDTVQLTDYLALII